MMKSSKQLQISSHLLFVYINNQDRKWRMSVLVFSSALARTTNSRSGRLVQMFITVAFDPTKMSPPSLLFNIRYKVQQY